MEMPLFLKHFKIEKGHIHNLFLYMLPLVEDGKGFTSEKKYAMIIGILQLCALVAQGIEQWFPVPRGGGSIPSGCVCALGRAWK